MTASGYWVIKVMLQGIAGVFLLLGAVCGFMDVWQDEKHERTRAWFTAEWVALSGSPWLSPPERVIQWFLRLPKCPWNPLWAVMRSRGCTDGVILLCCMCFALVLYLVSPVMLPGVPPAIVPAVIATSAVTYVWVWRRTGEAILGNTILECLLYVCGAVDMLLLVIICGLVMPLHVAAIMMAIVLIPVSLATCSAMALLLLRITGRSSETLDRLAFIPFWAVPASSCVTLLAMLVGHLADPSAWVPQTREMLASNVFFDTLTIVMTILLLRWGVAQRPMLRIPLAVFADLIIASIFAFGSLYFGLVFTKKALTLQQIAHVLIARSPDGSTWELGPYFWTMHTTFLPTLVYLSAVTLCWTGKAMLIPVHAFLGKGQEHSNPLKLTAGLCAVVAALFMLASLPFGAAQDYHEKQEKLLKKGKTAQTMPYRHPTYLSAQKPFGG